MADFEIKIYPIEIEEHPNADALELAKVGDYRAIVQKDKFQTGDYVIYIPEQALIPKWLLKHMNLWDDDKDKGKLAGRLGNRLKAIRLRGIISQGLVLPVVVDDIIDECLVALGEKQRQGFLFMDEKGMYQSVIEEDNLANILGITKWEPVIPAHMRGEIEPFDHTISYDIENIKKYPDVFQDNEKIIITDKIHGTWCCFGYHPEYKSSGYFNVIDPFISSKGHSGKGLVFKLNEQNENNLYIKTYKKLCEYAPGPIIMAGDEYFEGEPFYILGEVFGRGVQDLHYGADTPEFRVFDIYVGEFGKGRYLNFIDLISACLNLHLDIVPVLYKGPYSKEIINEYTSGMETISGKKHHIREGIVITPIQERRERTLGRVKLKSVSDKYLLRKGNITEFN